MYNVLIWFPVLCFSFLLLSHTAVICMSKRAVLRIGDEGHVERAVRKIDTKFA
jgi:hypothetical protein